jgi:hypothetical protein
VTTLNRNNLCKTYNFRIKGINGLLNLKQNGIYLSYGLLNLKQNGIDLSYGLLNLKQNGIDLSLSNKYGNENKKKLKNKKYYAIRAVPNPTGKS